MHDAREKLCASSPQLLGEISGGHASEKHDALADSLRETLDVKVVADERGRRRVSFAMPPRESLAALARGLAALLVGEKDDYKPRTQAPTGSPVTSQNGARAALN